MGQGHNKIRVVIRMRPYLENEEFELMSFSNVQAGGVVELKAAANEIK